MNAVVDFHGTLYDSFHAHLDAIKNANKKLREKHPAHEKQLRTPHAKDLREAYAHNTNQDLWIPEELQHEWNKLVVQHYDSKKARLVKGAGRFIRRLYAQNLEPVDVLTNSDTDLAEKALSGHPVTIHHTKDVAQTLRELEADTYIADTYKDAVEAHKAGVDFIGVAHDASYNTPTHLRAIEQIRLGRVVNTLEEVLQETRLPTP